METGPFVDAIAHDGHLPRHDLIWRRVCGCYPGDQVTSRNETEELEALPQNVDHHATHPIRSRNGSTSPRPQYSSLPQTGQSGRGCAACERSNIYQVTKKVGAGHVPHEIWHTDIEDRDEVAWSNLPNVGARCITFGGPLASYLDEGAMERLIAEIRTHLTQDGLLVNPSK